MSTETAVRAGRWPVVVAVAGATSLIDLATKAAVNLSPTLRSVPLVHPVTNPSYTLGIGGTDRDPALLALVSAITLLAAVWLYGPLRRGRREAIFAGLVVGGASGNLVDRLAHGGVTDFLLWVPGIVINLADVAVLLGVTALMFIRGHGHLHRASPPHHHQIGEQ